jgi:hypothetical protein
LQLGHLDENITGVQSEVSAESSMDATHFLLCVDVEDEKSVGRGEVRLIKELACTVSLSSRQPKESSEKSQETFSFQNRSIPQDTGSFARFQSVFVVSSKKYLHEHNS